MRHIQLSLAAALATTFFCSDVSAVPAFARQTGMACTACHTQHFPVLNGFGREFKAAGYTLMGAKKAKVESDYLSLPSTLNAGLLFTVRYRQDNTPATSGAGTSTPANLGDGRWEFGDNNSLFFGGRIADNIGFLLEGNLLGSGPSTSRGLLANIKIPFIWDTFGSKVGFIPFTTNANGVQYGYELSSGGVLRSNRWAEHRRETSAIQYNADQGKDSGAASGFAFIAQNDYGFINFSKWSPSFVPGGNGNSSTKLNNNYLRIAATPTLAEWSMLIGAGFMSGSSYSNVGTGQQVDSKQTFLDFQAQGAFNGKPLSLYAQHAQAPSSAIGNAYNPFNVAGNPDRKATTIGAEYSLLPNTLNLGAAYRVAQNGDVAGKNGDNALTMTAIYQMYQNVSLHWNHSLYDGSARDVTNAQKWLSTFMLEAAW